MAFHPMILNDPAIWALPPAEFKLYTALLVFVKPDGTGAFPTNETLAEMVGVNDKSIQRLLLSLESKGVIKRNRIDFPDGSFKRTITVNYVPVISKGERSAESKRYNQRGVADASDDRDLIHNQDHLTDEVHHLTGEVETTLPVTGGRTLPVRSEHTHIEHTQLTTSSRGSFSGNAESDDDGSRDLEPWESPKGNLPAPAPQPRVLRYRVALTDEQRDLAVQALGLTCTEGELIRVLERKPIVAEHPTFLAWALKQTIAKRPTKPIAYLTSLIQTSWADGAWVDPEEQDRIERQRKKQRAEERWAALKAKHGNQ